MQRDMGMGLSCYIVTLPRTKGRPAEIGIFDPAPLDAVGTVAEQDQYHQEWVASTPET